MTMDMLAQAIDWGHLGDSVRNLGQHLPRDIGIAGAWPLMALLVASVFIGLYGERLTRLLVLGTFIGLAMLLGRYVAESMSLPFWPTVLLTAALGGIVAHLFYTWFLGLVLAVVLAVAAGAWSAGSYLDSNELRGTLSDLSTALVGQGATNGSPGALRNPPGDGVGMLRDALGGGAEAIGGALGGRPDTLLGGGGDSVRGTGGAGFLPGGDSLGGLGGPAGALSGEQAGEALRRIERVRQCALQVWADLEATPDAQRNLLITMLAGAAIGLFAGLVLGRLAAILLTSVLAAAGLVYACLWLAVWYQPQLSGPLSLHRQHVLIAGAAAALLFFLRQLSRGRVVPAAAPAAAPVAPSSGKS